MTLVVGILCEDGVVVGTDSAMTFVAGPNMNTIEQPLRKKIDVQDNFIVTGTGGGGLGQRFVDTVKKCCNDGLLQKSAIDVGRHLSQKAIADFAQTNVQSGSYGALVAASCAMKAELIEFGIIDFQPEVKDKDNWYVSMGSGQPVADPLLGLVRKTFWGDTPPNLQDGIFAATMVLKLGCEMTPAGVSAPIQMAILNKKKKDGKGRPCARRIIDDELAEHEASVDSAIEYFRKYREELSSAVTALPTRP